MKITNNEELNSVILEADDKKRLTNRARTFYTKKIETKKDCIDLYEEVYYNENLNKEVAEEPSNHNLSDDDLRQIRDIQNMMKYLQSQLDDILK